MKTTTIANKVTHSVVLPVVTVTSEDCACILINTSSYVTRIADKPKASEAIYHIKNLTAPNSLFAEAAITNSLRDFGTLDTSKKAASEKLSRAGFNKDDIDLIISDITSYIDDLFPSEGV